MKLKRYEDPEDQSRVLKAYLPVSDSGHLSI
jgi:hypothetical protein